MVRWVNNAIKELLNEKKPGFRTAGGKKRKEAYIKGFLDEVEELLDPGDSYDDLISVSFTANSSGIRAHYLQMIVNWFNNNRKDNEEGVRDAPPKRKGHVWNYKKVVGELHRVRIREEITAMAVENKYEGDFPHLAFYKDALTTVTQEIEDDEALNDELLDVLECWNSAPPRSIQVKQVMVVLAHLYSC